MTTAIAAPGIVATPTIVIAFDANHSDDSFDDTKPCLRPARGTRRTVLVSTIKSEQRHGNLSSALRLFVLDHYRALAERHAMTKAARRSLPARGANHRAQ